MELMEQLHLDLLWPEWGVDRDGRQRA